MKVQGPAEPEAIFEAERPRLLGLAYRLLGSVVDAEDVVQEAWLRFARVDPDGLDRPAAWLTTVVSRLGLDRLRQRQRDRADYVGPWLPEPIVAEPSRPGVRPEADPADAAELADSLTTAFLVLLEQLNPQERLALLLADVFGEPFRDIAGVLGTGLPVWSRGAAAPPSVAGLTFVAWQQPVGCGGVAVFPDDWIVADGDGAVVVPAALAATIAGAAPEQERLEAWIMGEVEGGASLPGLYPPNAEQRARYDAWKKERS